MAPNPYFSDVQRGPWLTWERYLGAVYRHQRLNDGSPPPQPPTGLPQPQPRTAQGAVPAPVAEPTPSPLDRFRERMNLRLSAVNALPFRVSTEPLDRTAQGAVLPPDIYHAVPMTPRRRRRRRRRDGVPNRARTRSPVLVREDRLEVRSGTPPREATIVGPPVTPSRGIPQARPLTAAQSERIANTPAIPIAPLSVEGRQIVTEFGKIIKPYVQFIVKPKKPHGLYLKTKFGVQKLKDDKSGLYLRNNKNKKFYIYHWN